VCVYNILTKDVKEDILNHMVKYTGENLDSIFAVLADSTRRDILKRLLENRMTAGQIYEPYSCSISPPALSKHLKILEKADFVTRTKRGREHVFTIKFANIKRAKSYIDYYAEFWTHNLDRLEEYLKKGGE